MPAITNAPAPPAIEADGLEKSYGDAVALRGVGFAVDPGSVFALLGPNGAGKSTTVKILTTLTLADRGTARVAGVEVAREPERVRRAIGVVSQKHAVDLEATGRENLALQGRLHGVRGRELGHRVRALVERFGLGADASRLVKTYSGGMQRRLDVAMALIHAPRVLFLDEPTTGLDPEARADLWREIAALAAGEGVTVLLTTHYLDEADRLAQRVAIVDDGRIVAEGAPADLKRELRGDAIQVELAAGADVDAARAAVADLDGLLSGVVLERGTLRARADRGASALPPLLAALAGRDVAVATATVASPSLDDVYLRHTGKSLRDRDQETVR
jgi:ABC-2 type transport system ATP-binding protein